MVNWNVVELGFNPEDQTLNFGTRVFGGEANLYESCTLARIKSNDTYENGSNPTIKCYIKANKLFYVIDKTLGVFSDINCSNIDITIILEETIDVLSITKDGKYAFILLHDGSFKLLDVEEKSILIESKIMEHCGTENIFLDGYVQISTENQLVFLIITKTGDIFRIEFQDLQSKCSFEKCLLKQTHCDTKIVAFNYPYILLNGRELIVYNVKTDAYLEDEALDVVKAFPYGIDMFLVLDRKGNFYQICAKTMLYFNVGKTPFEDFIYLENSPDEKHECLLVGLTKKDELGVSYLKSFETILDFTNPIFSIKQNEAIHLIFPESIQNDYMYITNIKNYENITVEFRVQTICETAKEVRFERLLKRQKFAEAEMFAKLFNLDHTLILKARAKAHVSSISPSKETIQNLFEILNQIDDVEFKLVCCYDMYQLCDDVDDVRNVLQYAFEHVKNNPDNKVIEQLAKKITDVLNKLDTFTLIQRYQLNMSWDTFASYDLIDLFNQRLQMCEVEIAAVIFNRLDVLLTEADVEGALHTLDTVPLELHKRFLYAFVPISLRHLPSSIVVFVKWLKKKVFDMEKQEFADFHENAVGFIDEMMKLLKDDNIETCFQSDLFRDSLEEIGLLITALNRLKCLVMKYNITIPLKEYLKGSKSLVCTLLSITLTKEDFNKFYDDFLYNFILENNLHPDDVLLEEIERLMRYRETDMVTIIPTYLQKVLSIEKKLQAIIKIATSAKVPWSQSVRDIANSALEYDHPLVESIIELIDKEPMKTVLIKYNLHRYATSNNLKFPINRILYCNKETIIDDVIAICKTSEERLLGNYMLLHNLVLKRRFNDAYEMLQKIPPEDWVPLLNNITSKIIISSKNNFKSVQNYSNIIALLKRLYKQKGLKYKYEHNLDETLEYIASYFKIKEIYNEVTLNDLLDSKKREQLSDILVENALNKFVTNDADLNLLEDLIKQTAKCLNISNCDMIIKFVSKCNNLIVINKYANQYYLYEDNPEELFKMGVEIIKNISFNENNLNGDVTIQDLTVCYTGDIKTLITNIRLAQKLLIKAISLDENNNNEFLEMYLIVKRLFGTISQNQDVKKYVGTSLRSNAVENAAPSTRTFYVVNDMLQVYVKCTKLFNIPNVRYLKHFSQFDVDLVDVDNEQILSQIKTTIHNLYMEGHVLTVYHLLMFFLLNFNNEDEKMVSVLKNILKKQCIPQLLEKVFHSNVIDSQFAFTLLISIDLSQFLNLIKGYIMLYKANPAKLYIIMQLVVKVFKYHNTKPHESYLKLLLLSKWWLKIDNCKIRMKTFFVSSTEELLNLLFTHDHLKLDMMEEFCKDFALDLQYCYHIYLEKLITNWKPTYEVISKGDGKSKLQMKSTENELYEKCEKVLTLIKAKELLPKYIQTFCPLINFYYYEAFMCVFKILSMLTKDADYSNKQQLLIFLKMYLRVNKPKNLELEEWFAAFPGSGSIDPLSNYRLPFSQILFTKDVWEVIRPEINLKTYTVWFKAIPLLHKSLNIDDICSFVVKDVVSSGILSEKSDNWVLVPVHENLFNEIDKCVQHITDIEKATSVINHLMIHTPKGADQVNAAVLCLNYAKKYKQSQTSTDRGVEDAFNKIRNKYFKYSVCHILHTCKLNSEDFSEVLLQPHELIDMLYTHEDIQTINSSVLSSPNINKAVDDIAALYNIDILQKRKDLLETFLSGSNNPGNILKDTEIINLKRAAYICKSGDLLVWQTHLATLGLQEEVELNLRAKANALKCLTMISDVDTIEEIVDLGYEAFLNYIDKIYLLSDLEYRGFSMTLDQLNKYNKKNLLRQLAQDMLYPGTVKIMGDICMVYSILDTKYWSKIIEVSIKLDLYDNLKRYINFWTSNPYAKYKNFYIEAWQYVVDNCFNECASNKSDVFNYCVRNVLMIQSCPVLHSLNFDGIFKKLIQMDQFDFAAVFIQYLPNETQEQCVVEILNSTNQSLDVSGLREYGIFGIDFIEAMLRQ